MRNREAAIGEVEFELGLKDEWGFNRLFSNVLCRGNPLWACTEAWENRVC